jgi:hypothetical protein
LVLPSLPPTHSSEQLSDLKKAEASIKNKISLLEQNSLALTNFLQQLTPNEEIDAKALKQALDLNENEGSKIDTDVEQLKSDLAEVERSIRKEEEKLSEAGPEILEDKLRGKLIVLVWAEGEGEMDMKLIYSKQFQMLVVTLITVGT